MQIQPGLCVSVSGAVSESRRLTPGLLYFVSAVGRPSVFTALHPDVLDLLLYLTVTFLTWAQLLGESDTSLRSLLCPPSPEVIWSRHKTKSLVTGSQLGSSRMARTLSCENVWGKPENKELLLRA